MNEIFGEEPVCGRGMIKNSKPMAQGFLQLEYTNTLTHLNP